MAAGWPKEDVTGCVSMMAIFALLELPPLEEEPEDELVDEPEPPPELACEAELELLLDPQAAAMTTTAVPTATVAAHRKRDLLILTPFKLRDVNAAPPAASTSRFRLGANRGCVGQHANLTSDSSRWCTKSPGRLLYLAKLYR